MNWFILSFLLIVLLSFLIFLLLNQIKTQRINPRHLNKNKNLTLIEGFKTLAFDALFEFFNKKITSFWAQNFNQLQSTGPYSKELLQKFIHSLSPTEIEEIWPSWKFIIKTLAYESYYNQGLIIDQEKEDHERKSINKAYFQVIQEANVNHEKFINKIKQFQFNYFLENKQIIN